MLRRVHALLGVLLVTGLLAASASAAPQPRQKGPGFDAFLRTLWPLAKAQGISRATFDAAFAGLTPDARVLRATQRQPEFGKPVGAYVHSIVSTANIATGRRKAAEWGKTLDAVERKFGVDRWVLLAIWGMETSYGALKDRWDPFRSLATLAQARYRHPYFRNELIVALKILQAGHIPRTDMRSSWAGAMGQTQFMPSNFMEHAIDFSGDGRPDIWTNVPDVLGSTANYLHKGGWKPGLTWGYEVLVPDGFDYRHSRDSFTGWSMRGVRRADGGGFPSHGNGILFFPSGASGPAFLATDNYPVLKEYNNSDAYVIAVGHLADRLRAMAPIRAAWPRDDRPLPRDRRIALQRKLATLGYKVNEFEGHIDFDLRDTIRLVQVKFGMRPDGHPTAALLERLGVK
jgi:lytic murein transglycosylase